MRSRFFLGAYWGARRETIDQCADRLQRMFSDLSASDDTLVRWYQLGWSRGEALKTRAEVDRRECLLNLLELGRNRRDTDKTVIEELGFSISLWNKAATPEKEVGLGVICGAYGLSPNLGNCVTLDLPEDLGDLKEPDRMAAVVSAVVRSWDPDWAGVMSSDAMDARGFDAREPFVDWILYLSRRLVSDIPHLAPPATVQPVGQLGSIIIVQPEPPDPANRGHQQNIDRVDRALKGRAFS